MGLLLATALVLAMLSYRYLKAQRRRAGRSSTSCCSWRHWARRCWWRAAHFASFFLGLEILSVSLYALIAYHRTSADRRRGGVKYLVLAAVSTAFLLFGMALVYAEIGTMEFAQIAALRGDLGDAERVFFIAGLALMVVGIGFKLAVVPFHLWTPDVYQGAPAPVTAFVATVSKGGMFALLLRFFTQIDFHADDALFWMFTAVAIASMLAGNLLALLQNNVKRILAYSSIAHFGYLLVAFLASGDLRRDGGDLLPGGLLRDQRWAPSASSPCSPGRDRDADRIEDYRGLFWRRPWLAGVFTAMLLSLAGIPLTAGFVGKFYLVAAGAQSALWALVIILVVSSAIGLFYYLRIIVAMYSQAPEETAPAAPRALAPSETLVLAVAASLAVWLGVYPSSLLRVIEALVK